jgi:hypothetical protein
MPFTQIDDMLCFDGEVVRATGTLVRPQDLDLNPDNHPGLNPEVPIADEIVKTLWVRVCQGEVVSDDEMRAHIAEGSAFDDSFLGGDGTWQLALPIRDGSEFREGDAAVTATLVYEAGDDLFSLTWAECVHLHPCDHC